MRILINIGHPAHVHLFRNVINNLEKKGHKIDIVTRDKDVTLKLLDSFKFDYKVMSGYYNTLLGKMYDFLKTELKLSKIAFKIQPDLLIAVGDPYVAHVGLFIRKPSIVFTDTEDAKLANRLTFPFATVICTPSVFKKDLGKKQVRYNGYHELAYLHPNWFIPDPTVLDDLGISKNEKFIVVRFISWAASHDMNLSGIKENSELSFIKKLEKYGRVYISSEKPLNSELASYSIKIPPEKMHSLLYYAHLYIGEGGTMAAEAALLGTPAIHIEANASGQATGSLCGNFIELRDKYGLLYYYPTQEDALEKANEILGNPRSKEEWHSKKEKLLAEKIDVTAWMTDFIERYPESFYEHLRNLERIT